MICKEINIFVYKYWFVIKICRANKGDDRSFIWEIGALGKDIKEVNSSLPVTVCRKGRTEECSLLLSITLGCRRKGWGKRNPRRLKLHTCSQKHRYRMWSRISVYLQPTILKMLSFVQQTLKILFFYNRGNCKYLSKLYLVDKVKKEKLLLVSSDCVCDFDIYIYIWNNCSSNVSTIKSVWLFVLRHIFVHISGFLHNYEHVPNSKSYLDRKDDRHTYCCHNGNAYSSQSYLQSVEIDALQW